MVRLLHTSDWHLGVSMNDASCLPEQQRFLDWLIDTIVRRQIDVLVVAGDIFHLAQPSNSAKRLYFDFLRRCRDATDLRQVVITGGNHDSPTGLESPGPVLETLDVAVVGSIRTDEGLPTQCLVPVEGPSGDVELVVCAVPYVRSAQLGVSAIDGSPTEVRRDFERAFGELYTDLADAAEDRWGDDVPLVATGHLTCRSGNQVPDSDDYNTAIHSVGTIEAMGASLFDDRYDYVALGHIHKPFPVDKPRIWYSGTPVATSQNEHLARKVIDVGFAGDEPGVELVEVPCWRQLHKLEGTVEEVAEQLRAIENHAEFAPFVFIRVRDDDYGSKPLDELQSICQEEFDEPRPRIVEFRSSSAGGVPENAEPPEQLDELDPEEVFVRLYRSRRDDREPDEKLLRAFRELLPQQTDDEDDAEQPAPEPAAAVQENR